MLLETGGVLHQHRRRRRRTTPAAAALGWKRIDAGRTPIPTTSFLYHKITGDLPDPLLGARMPFGRPKLDQFLIDIVRLWIEAGAPQTGVGARAPTDGGATVQRRTFMPVNPGAHSDRRRSRGTCCAAPGFGARAEGVRRLSPGPTRAARRRTSCSTSSASRFKPGGKDFDQHAQQVVQVHPEDASTPLHEKLVLFWHDHFATGFSKVHDTKLMGAADPAPARPRARATSGPS